MVDDGGDHRSMARIGGTEAPACGASRMPRASATLRTDCMMLAFSTIMVMVAPEMASIVT
jgi:hypothetical protein